MCPSRHSCPLSGKLDKLEPQFLQRAERGDGLIHISGDHVVIREKKALENRRNSLKTLSKSRTQCPYLLKALGGCHVVTLCWH